MFGWCGVKSVGYYRVRVGVYTGCWCGRLWWGYLIGRQWKSSRAVAFFSGLREAAAASVCWPFFMRPPWLILYCAISCVRSGRAIYDADSSAAAARSLGLLFFFFFFFAFFFGADLPPPIRVAAASFACASIRAIRPSSTLYPTLIGSPISSDVVESDLFRRRVSILAHFFKILPDFLPSIFLLVPITIFWFEVKVALLMFFCLSQFWLLLAVPCSVLHI